MNVVSPPGLTLAGFAVLVNLKFVGQSPGLGTAVGVGVGVGTHPTVKETWVQLLIGLPAAAG